jgi:ADP-ribose pyrophosphatase
MSKVYKVLSSEYVHRAPWLTARRDKLQVPNGHVIPDYYVLEYAHWVNTIALTKDGEMVMIKNYRYAIDQTHYELCAGVMDDDDKTPMDAAKRELLEETGYGGGEWKEWMLISPNPATHTNMNYCFIAYGVEKIAKQDLEPSETLTVHVLKQDEVRQLLKDEQIINCMHVAPLWKYFAEKV